MNDQGLDFNADLESYQRVYAEVDLDAIAENVEKMQRMIAEKTKILGVVKADGYGHGSVPIARRLEHMDFIFGFAVATPEEAHILRDSGIRKPIIILGYAFPYSYKMLAEEEIRPTVFRRDSIAELETAGKKAGKPVKVHIKVDTGMNRIGVRPDGEGIVFVRELMKQKWIEIEGIYTHFARADEADTTSVRKQLEIFQDFLHMIKKELFLDIPVKHCSNSAGILQVPEANMDMVRAGIAMYGIYPSDQICRNTICLKPAFSLYSHVVYVKSIGPGESVSYGGTFTADRKMRIATIPVGYGDGYPRSLSNKGYVLIRGRRAGILGRICMDQFMVDVSDIPEAAEGDQAVLLGADGEEAISAEALGEISGRFHYELVCDFGSRVPRIYKEKGKIPSCCDLKKQQAEIL